MPQCQTACKQWLTIPEVIPSIDIFVRAKIIICYTQNQDVFKVIPYFWPRSLLSDWQNGNATNAFPVFL